MVIKHDGTENRKEGRTERQIDDKQTIKTRRKTGKNRKREGMIEKRKKTE